MYISFATSRVAGFKKWSDAHPSASNDDDYPAGATPVALAAPSVEGMEIKNQPHCPWWVPGVGVSLTAGRAKLTQVTLGAISPMLKDAYSSS